MAHPQAATRSAIAKSLGPRTQACVNACSVHARALRLFAKHQHEGARALNLSAAGTFTHIVEMRAVAKIVGDRTLDYLVPPSMVGGLYLIMTLVASAGGRLLDGWLPKQGIPLQ